MKGDVILVEEHHKKAAERIIERFLAEIFAKETRYAITVAGESGSGKSETAQAIAEALEPHGVTATILQQDDYFVHPPPINDRTRRANICWVGPSEVRLDLLDEHLRAAVDGAEQITKPLIAYREDRIFEETLDLTGAGAVIAEGTYTSLLENVDRRVFIARNRLDTMEHRQKRAREDFDPFLENVLEIEHEIIAAHRQLADAVVTREYDVEFPGL